MNFRMSNCEDILECVGEPHSVEADGKSPDARLPKSQGMRITQKMATQLYAKNHLIKEKMVRTLFLDSGLEYIF